MPKRLDALLTMIGGVGQQLLDAFTYILVEYLRLIQVERLQIDRY